jgi:hypothetical protein
VCVCVRVCVCVCVRFNSLQAMDDPLLIKSIEAAIMATNKNGEICPSNASL